MTQKLSSKILDLLSAVVESLVVVQNLSSEIHVKNAISNIITLVSKNIKNIRKDYESRYLK